MRRIGLRRFVSGGILALGLTTAAASPAFAQGAGDAGATQTETEDRDDDNGEWGLAGLLGLLGLLGLRRRDDHRDTTPRPRP
jgi:MYXO-CTERM domain-containing protein